MPKEGSLHTIYCNYVFILCRLGCVLSFFDELKKAHMFFRAISLVMRWFWDDPIRVVFSRWRQQLVDGSSPETRGSGAGVHRAHHRWLPDFFRYHLGNGCHQCIGASLCATAGEVSSKLGVIAGWGRAWWVMAWCPEFHIVNYFSWKRLQHCLPWWWVQPTCRTNSQWVGGQLFMCFFPCLRVSIAFFDIFCLQVWVVSFILCSETDETAKTHCQVASRSPNHWFCTSFISPSFSSLVSIAPRSASFPIPRFSESGWPAVGSTSHHRTAYA